MSVRRVKSKAICYLGPLPDDLPKPAHLKAELQGVCMVKRLTAGVSTSNCCEKKQNETKQCGNLTRLYSLRKFAVVYMFFYFWDKAERDACVTAVMEPQFDLLFPSHPSFFSTLLL